MARCIAFDKPTAQAISRNLHLLTVCDPEADPLQTALHSNAHLSLLALPSESGKHVLVAKFRRPALAPVNNDPVGFEASGFLGLSDEPVYVPERPARKWWQKLLE
jgi:hypothetical protein